MKGDRPKAITSEAPLSSKKSTLIVQNCQSVRPVNLPRLKSITRTLLAELMEIEAYEVGICLVNAGEMTHLNETFLRHQGSTDVLAFDYSERSETRALCGEVIVCVEEAVHQARRFRTNWQSEVVRYIVHGFLHLLGYDDHHLRDRREMKRAENRLLRQIARRFAGHGSFGLGLSSNRMHLEPKGRRA